MAQYLGEVYLLVEPWCRGSINCYDTNYRISVEKWKDDTSLLNGKLRGLGFNGVVGEVNDGSIRGLMATEIYFPVGETVTEQSAFS